MTIRPATSADAVALAELRWEFRTALAPAVESRGAFVTRCSGWMASHLAQERIWRAWVAIDRDAVAGNVWVQLIEKIPNATAEPEYHAYITNMYVRPAARGGTGSRLLEEALAWIRGAGVAAIILWPTARSRSLYGRHGFQQPEDILTMSLGANRLGL